MKYLNGIDWEVAAKNDRDYGISRIRHFIKMAEKADSPFNIEADFYAIMQIATRVYGKLRERNKDYPPDMGGFHG